MFKRPGEYDEDSFWYAWLSPEMKALDMAAKARVAAAHAAADANVVDLAQDQKIAQLEQRLFSLGLYARTLLQLLVDKEILTLDEFQAQMNALDDLDGRRDGR